MSSVKYNRYWAFCILVVSFQNLKAQVVPYMERPVTIHASNQLLTEVFKNISAQTSVIFSYSQTFNDKQKVSLNYQKKPLRLVLNDVLKGANCSYKIKDKYIIIKYENTPAIPPAILTGYIYNASDSSAVSKASIYIKQTKHSAISNDYGFFSLSYSNKLPDISISFAKEDYKDTSLVIYNQSKREVLVYLYPKYRKKDTIISLPLPIVVKDSVIILPAKDSIIPQEKYMSRFWKKFKNFNTNFRNINDTLFSNVSLSFVPYISTNHLLSINTVNKYSFNILTGYSKGVDVFELGGLLNLDNGNVKYVQIGGLGNVVSGNLTGVQIGGLFNANSRNTVGVQMDGIMNTVKLDMKGVQTAGIVNNVHGNMKGVQTAGIINVIKQDIRGGQIAGIYNYAGSIKGIQLSGIANLADTVKGLQLAGIVNRAKCVSGIQFSFLNFADTASGIPVGFFSYIKKGYHKIELATDELKFITLAYTTGVEKFHTIFFGGGNYSNSKLLTFGYGVGTHFSFNKRMGLSVELSSQQIQSSVSNTIKLHVLNKLFVGLEYKAASKFRIDLGPTFNLFRVDITDMDYLDLYDQLSSYHFYNRNFEDANIKMWVGAKLSLKFF